MGRRNSGRIGAFVAVAAAVVLVSAGFLMLPTSGRAPSPLEDESGDAHSAEAREPSSETAPRIAPRPAPETEDVEEGDEGDGDEDVAESEPAEISVAAFLAPGEPKKTIRFQVHGTGGEPVAGAFAQYVGDTERSAATGPDGMGTLTIRAVADRIWVGALRYDAAEVMLPETLDGVIPVVLRPNAGIELRLVGVSEEDAKGVIARITVGTREIFSADPPRLACHPTVCAAGGASFGMGWRERPGGFALYAWPATWPVRMAGLKPGIAIEVEAVDQLDQTLARRVVVLGEGEWTTVDLVVAKGLRTLVGTVRGARGEPIDRARVLLSRDPVTVGERSSWLGFPAGPVTRTSADGRFALRGVHDGAAMHLAVDRVGYVPLIKRNFVQPPAGTELEFTLEKGCKLTLRVVDSKGVPVDILEPTAVVTGFPKIAGVRNYEAPDAYVFADIAPGSTAKIAFDCAAKSWSQSVTLDRDRTETMTIPPTGMLRVDYGALIPKYWRFTLNLASTDGSGFSLTQILFHFSERGHACDVGPIMPGAYVATLQSMDCQPPNPPPALPEPVTVTAGETTRIVFRKP